MSYWTQIGFVTSLAAFLLPSLALSETATLSYVAAIEPVMLDVETAGFKCPITAVPAHIEIDDGRFVAARAEPDSPTTEPDDQPAIVVRRGTEIVPQRGTDGATLARSSGWGMAVKADIDICIGLARLEVIQGRLDVFGKREQDTQYILGSYDVLQDLVIRYETDASGVKQVSFVYPTADGSASAPNGRTVGSLIPTGARNLDGSDLGERQRLIAFTRPNDPESVTQISNLHVRFVLEEPSTVPE